MGMEREECREKVEFLLRSNNNIIKDDRCMRWIKAAVCPVATMYVKSEETKTGQPTRCTAYSLRRRCTCLKS
jgi:hypothetical protein